MVEFTRRNWKQKRRFVRIDLTTKFPLIILFLTVSFLSITASEKVTQTSCSIPPIWDGTWFIQEAAREMPRLINSRKSLITLSDGTLSNGVSRGLGKCILSDNNDIFVFRDDNTNCSKCVLILQRHKNVLYSVEDSNCKHDNEWDPEHFKDTLCPDLGYSNDLDSSLYWFRKEFEASPCPFQGTTSQFSYWKTNGKKCDNPLNLMTSCFNNVVREIHYEACHDQSDSVNRDERIRCLGNWIENGYKYLAAEVIEQSRPNHPEYRCYAIKEESVQSQIHGKPAIVKGYKIGVSEQATCNGLHNPDEGQIVIDLKIENSSPLKPKDSKCSFPTWLTSQDWQSFESTFLFKIRNSKMQISPIINTRSEAHRHDNKTQFASFHPSSRYVLECVRAVTGENEDNYHFKFVAKYSLESECGVENFIYFNFVRRSTYVVQVYSLEKSPEEDTPTFLENSLKAPLESLNKGLTLIGNGLKTGATCPNQGRYVPGRRSWKPVSTTLTELELKGIFSHSSSEWIVGCGSLSQVEILPFPNSVSTDHLLQCIGDWEDASTSFTVLTTSSLEGGSMLKISHDDNNEDVFLCMRKKSGSDQIHIGSRDCLYFNADEIEDYNGSMGFEDKEDEQGKSEEKSNLMYFVELRKSALCLPGEDLSTVEENDEELTQNQYTSSAPTFSKRFEYQRTIIFLLMLICCLFY